MLAAWKTKDEFGVAVRRIKTKQEQEMQATPKRELDDELSWSTAWGPRNGTSPTKSGLQKKKKKKKKIKEIKEERLAEKEKRKKTKRQQKMLRATLVS
jgi:hypothetical protein